MFTYRTKCIYNEDKILACFVFDGDGKYINKKRKVFIGVSEELINRFFDLDKHYTLENDLFIRLYDLCKENMGIIFTEDELQSSIKSVSDDLLIGHSQRYVYPNDRVGIQVFRNVCKNNNLFDIRKVVGDDSAITD